MERRDFLKILSSSATIAIYPSLIKSDLYASNGELYRTYEKVQLLDEQGNPILASKLEKEKNYVFNYPYVGTSCFLLALPNAADRKVHLKSEDEQEYIWEGGVGKEKNIVAYSSICPHQMTHINKNDSFISYVKKGQKTMASEKSSIIVCGSHLSAYNPHQGCKVIGGPAPEPLASIILEHLDDDTLWAVAVLGPDKFHEFFRAFKPELKEQFGSKRKAKKLVKKSSTTLALVDYTKDIIQY